MANAAEVAAYGQPQAAFASGDAIAAAVAASAFPKNGLVLPLIFHVVTWKGRNSVADTRAPVLANSQLTAQWTGLQRDFKSAGIQFQAPTIMRHENQAWAARCYDRLGAISKAVVQNPATSVNVIVCDLYSGTGIFGVTPEMPSPTNANSPTSCVAVDFRSLPGGPIPAYNQGKTLTHELGHFFGLSHVFGDGGCGFDDGIADTPAMAKPTGGCPVKAMDSCPGSPGTDPSWSFMDYSDDACMSRFSPGQGARMQAIVLAVKPAMLAYGVPVPSPPPLKASPPLVPAKKPPPPLKKPALSPVRRNRRNLLW